jgi:hypothetical protein
MVLFVEIRPFCMKTKNPIHLPKKSWFFPTLGHDSVPKNPDWLGAEQDSSAGPRVWLPYHMIMPKNLREAGCVHAAKWAIHHQQALSDKIHALCSPPPPGPGAYGSAVIGQRHSGRQTSDPT